MKTDVIIGTIVVICSAVFMFGMVALVIISADKAKAAQIESDKYTYYTPCQIVQKSKIVGNIFGEEFVKIYDVCEPIKDANPILGSEWNTKANKFKYGIALNN